MAVARQDLADVNELPDAVATLVDEHRYMSLLLDTLDERISGKDEIPATDYFLIHDIVRYMHEYPDAVHHPTEDLMFAKLVVRDPSMNSSVQELQRDHRKLTGDTARILALLGKAEREQSKAAADAIRSACGRYTERLRNHMRREETTLFPRAVACLAPRDWKLIERRLSDVDDPLFGRTVDSRFRVLFEYFSAQAGDVSRQITLFSFLNFDNVIESADCLERGASELIALFRGEAGSVIDETRSRWQQTMESHDLLEIVSSPLRYATFLGRKTVTIGSAASKIYWNTAKQILVPFSRRKRTR
jgi:hemerythrin-like domain-containing protein